MNPLDNHPGYARFKTLLDKEMANQKLFWGKKSELELTATADLGLSDTLMDPIQKWCEESGIGTRTSYDTFKFKNKKHLTIFLLRWS